MKINKLKTLKVSTFILACLNLSSYALEYTGEVVFDNDAQKLASFQFEPASHEWRARSLNTETDASIAWNILAQQNPEKRVYLPAEEGKVIPWLQRTNNQPYYRPFLIETQDEGTQPLALVEVHTMPRAVTHLDSQSEILDFYCNQGLMTFDENNESVQWFGKYRPVEDAPSSMARIRFMPVQNLLENPGLMTNMIKGSALFIKKLVDQGYPMHTYPTDKIQGLPKIVMSYTVLEEPLRESYQSAGFTLHTNDIFREFWPPEMHINLPGTMVVATQDLVSISSDSMNLNTIQ